MSSAAQIAANIANAQHSTGPRTEEGKAASSRNATKSGLFSTTDFIRPGEEPLYADLTDGIRRELAPVGELECNLADEIRRVMWRLRRCADTEAAMLETCIAAVGGPESPIPDPLQNEATAPLQRAVDRARSQCHRLLHKCTAELRKLQTERWFRAEELGPKIDSSTMGVADLRAVRKSLDESNAAALRQHKITCIESRAAHEREMAQAMAVPEDWLPSSRTETPVAKQSQPPRTDPRPNRNSRCACGSGLKYKRCCARNGQQNEPSAMKAAA